MKVSVTKVKRWKAPSKNDVRVLGMPNIPKPLHGPGCQPRTIVGATKWNQMRLRCYENAGYKCEVCGFQGEPGKAQLHAHEIFDIDYEKGTSTFVRLACLCPKCHLSFIHSGRALTMFKNHNPIYSKEKLLEGAEHGFKLIAEYNKTHKQKIKVFSAMADYLRQPELEEDMDKLVKKYGISFYSPISVKKGAAKWEDWRMVYNGQEYRTPYKDEEAWAKKMDELNTRDSRGEMTKRMSGGVFDEIDKILQEELTGGKNGNINTEERPSNRASDI